MATYAEYDEALKKQDSWWEWYRRCARFDQPLTGPAIGNGGDNMRSCLEKAHDRIVEGSVWYGEDALACARVIWEIRNETVAIANRLNEIREAMMEYCKAQRYQWQQEAKRCQEELWLLAKGENFVRSGILGDPRRS